MLGVIPRLRIRYKRASKVFMPLDSGIRHSCNESGMTEGQYDYTDACGIHFCDKSNIMWSI